MTSIKQAAKGIKSARLRKVLSNIWHEYKWLHQFIYFTTKHPNVKLLRLTKHKSIELKTCGFRSQFGQDHFLNDFLFHNKKNGVFIDIGANDPEYNSNSYFFEKHLNWSGLAIEPQQKFRDKWAKLRNAEFINVGVGAHKGRQKFIEYSSPNAWEDQLSCVVGHERSEDASLQGEVYEIPIMPLNQILKERNINNIELLSIDVEGYEEEVLKGINFNEIRPQVILLENMAKMRGKESLREFMAANEYDLIYRIWTTDDVYIDKRHQTA